MPGQRKARPWLGFIVGAILGIALAVILQQAGVWPLDRFLLFGMIGVFGLAGILIAGAGRARASFIVLIIPLVLSIAAIAFGATGLLDAGDTGNINGGCTVTASTPLDSTTVTDTSRGDPFDVDPDGFLTWEATSPVAFKNHLWNVYVEVGGFDVRVAWNDEPDPNDAESMMNGDTIPSVAGYVEDVTNTIGRQLRGVFIVSGDITGEGGSCDGFAFVRLVDDPFSSLVSQVALGLAVIMIIILIIIFMRRSYAAEVVDQAVVGDAEVPPEQMDEAVEDAVEQATEGLESGAEDLPRPDDLA